MTGIVEIQAIKMVMTSGWFCRNRFTTLYDLHPHNHAFWKLVGNSRRRNKNIYQHTWKMMQRISSRTYQRWWYFPISGQTMTNPYRFFITFYTWVNHLFPGTLMRLFTCRTGWCGATPPADGPGRAVQRRGRHPLRFL